MKVNKVLWIRSLEIVEASFIARVCLELAHTRDKSRHYMILYLVQQAAMHDRDKCISEGEHTLELFRLLL